MSDTTEVKITPMTPEAAQAWIDHLNKPHVKQSKGELFRLSGDSELTETQPMCCLGHLAFINGHQEYMTAEDPIITPGSKEYCGPFLQRAVFPTESGAKISLSHHYGLTSDQANKLAHNNDKGADGFPTELIKEMFIDPHEKKDA